jgi:hypothetical protein
MPFHARVLSPLTRVMSQGPYRAKSREKNTLS